MAVPIYSSTLRFIPDVTRNEQLNIGVCTWTQGAHCVLLDSSALGRVLKFYPYLDADTFTDFQLYLEETLVESGVFNDLSSPGRILDTVRFPVLATEPVVVRQLDPAPTQTTQIRAEVTEDARFLLKRLVTPFNKPRRRPSTPNAIQERLQAEFVNDIKEQRVKPKHEIQGGITNEPRILPYFANSGTDIGLNVVTLHQNTSSEETIRHAADQFAFELMDMVQSSEVNRIIVYIPADVRDLFREWVPAYERRLQLVAENVDFEHTVDDAVGVFRSRAGLVTT